MLPAAEVPELVDVVDVDDHVIATVTRAEMRARRLLHRSVAVAVLSTRSAGEEQRLLIHRRSDAKDLWPGQWDIAAGGVVAAGETYEDAASRELAEELGITVAELNVLGGGTFVDDQVATIGRCFFVEHDGPFTFSDAEVVEARWVTADELDRLRAIQPFVPDSIACVLPLLPWT